MKHRFTCFMFHAQRSLFHVSWHKVTTTNTKTQHNMARTTLQKEKNISPVSPGVLHFVKRQRRRAERREQNKIITHALYDDRPLPIVPMPYVH